jgi:hypothetical protein
LAVKLLTVMVAVMAAGVIGSSCSGDFVGGGGSGLSGSGNVIGSNGDGDSGSGAVIGGSGGQGRG